MLDPNNDQAVEYEQSQAGREHKRVEVLANGIRASVRLFEENPRTERQELAPALQKLAGSDLQRIAPQARRGIRLEAEEALHKLRSRDAAAFEQ
jgi:hypothetical protein